MSTPIQRQPLGDVIRRLTEPRRFARHTDRNDQLQARVADGAGAEARPAPAVTTLAHDLELLEGVGMVCGLQKHAGQALRQRASSPKPQVFNTALMGAIAAGEGFGFQRLQDTPELWGRRVESAVGAELLAMEVKSGGSMGNVSGLDAFITAHPGAHPTVIGTGGMPLQTWFSAA